jgi:putative ABC transport system ATP-binding protein
MIKTRNLKKIYPGNVPTVALDGVSFDIKEGEFVAIIGPSGSGKSTLMHIISLLDRPTSGVCEFKGDSIDDFSDDELARLRNKQIGFVFQTFNLLPKTTVWDNVRLPLVYSGVSKEVEERKSRESLESVDLSHRINHYPNQLSGGEKQRVAIARALVNNPSIIFADEPTGNLDSKSGQQVMDILQKINDEGHTVVLVTHEKYTSEMAKRIIVLKDGRIVNDEIVAHRRFARDGLIK